MGLELFMVYSLIDIGGGMRDAFGAGVVDYLLDEKINIGMCIGVSAGASNLTNYISGQRERVVKFYDTYPNRKEYMSLWSLFKTGSYLSLEYIYEKISFPEGEDPFDIESFMKSEKDLTLVATNGITGEPVYFPKSSIRPYEMKAAEASSTIPLICRPTIIDGVPYFDGGVADPIPYKKAFRMGADKIIIIITKRKDDFRDPEKDRIAVKLLSRKYPKLSDAISRRAELYNQSLREAIELEKKGKILIIAPDDTFGVTTTKHPKEYIDKLYRHGYEKARAIKGFIE